MTSHSDLAGREVSKKWCKPQTANSMSCDTTTLFAVPEPTKPGMSLLAAASIFFVAVAIGYGCTVSNPFIHEDKFFLLWNPLFGQTDQAGSFLFERTTEPRPLVFASFYINYLISGFEVWSYHLVNMLIHALAALTLFGIVRLSIRWPELREQYWSKRDCLSLACGLIWALHPLQTQSVTYISQRSESFAGLFLLLTLYCAIHFFQARASRSRQKWMVFAGANLVLGVLCKEFVAIITVLILCYEYVFCKITRRSVPLYLCLLPGLGTAVILFFGFPNTTEGVAAVKLSHLDYFLTQAEIIWQYVSLAVWPDALIFDYVHTIDPLSVAWPYVAGLGIVACVAGWGVWKRKPWGVVLAGFLLTLAPTSSFLPMPALAAENRMYVPLASLVILVVFGVYHFGVRLLHITVAGPDNRARIGLILGRVLLFVCCSILLTLTMMRNWDYRSELGLWLDTLAKQKENYRAYAWAGAILVDQAEPEKAIPYLEESLKIKPDSFNARLHMGRAMSMLDHDDESMRWFRESLSLNPTNYRLCNHVGVVLFNLGNKAAAREVFSASKRLEPSNSTADKYLSLLPIN